MSFPLIDIALARVDNFMNRLGFQPVARAQNYRQQPLQNAQPKKPAALFGASRDEGFALDWASEPGTPKGGSNTTKSELVDYDSSRNLETWVPVHGVPSLVAHGRKLNYENQSDQRPVLSFSGTIDEKWDGIVRSEPKKSLETSARVREKTVADKIAEELKNEPYWFGA